MELVYAVNSSSSASSVASPKKSFCTDKPLSCPLLTLCPSRSVAFFTCETALATDLYVVDLNTPCERTLVFSCDRVLNLLLFSAKNNVLVAADVEGFVYTYVALNSDLGLWTRLSLAERWRGERFFKGIDVDCVANNFFVRKTIKEEKDIKEEISFGNDDNLSSGDIKSGLSGRYGRHLVRGGFRKQRVAASNFVAVSKTGLILALETRVQRGLEVERGGENNDGCRASALWLVRGGPSVVKVADLGFVNGDLLVALSDGNAFNPVRLFKVFVEPNLDDDFRIKAEHFASFSVSNPLRNITQLSFLPRRDAIAVGLEDKENSGNSSMDETVRAEMCTARISKVRLELFELQTHTTSLHKIFQNESDGNKDNSIALPVWKSCAISSILSSTYPSMKSSSSVTCVASPWTNFEESVTGNCILVAAFKDGKVVCFDRATLRILSELNLASFREEMKRDSNVSGPAVKRARGENHQENVYAVSMHFTSNCQALVVLDSESSLYYFSLSKVLSPTPAADELRIKFELCLLSGLDPLDLILDPEVNPHMLQKAMEDLTKDYESEPQAFKIFHYSRFTALKLTLERVLNIATTSLPLKSSLASDEYKKLLLHVVSTNFRSVLRQCSATGTGTDVYERIVKLLESKKDEVAINEFVTALHAIQNDFIVAPSVLQSVQSWMQFSVNMAISLMASLPECKTPLHSDTTTLATLRQHLLLLRMWQSLRLWDSCSGPVITCMSTNVDIVSKLFSMVTKLRQPNELITDQAAFIEECLLLPSQVIVPSMSVDIGCRGLISQKTSITKSEERRQFFSFDDNMNLTSDGVAKKAPEFSVFLDGHKCYSSAGRNLVDCVRQIYLGRRPFAIKQCTRCFGVSLSEASLAQSPPTSHDRSSCQRCPCGGNWKSKILKKKNECKRDLEHFNNMLLRM